LPNNTDEFSCHSITFFFFGFPTVPHNKVPMNIRVDGVLTTATFTFNGPTGSYTFNLNLPPGHHTMDAKSSWNTNQFKGGKDIVKSGGVICNAEPAYTLVKQQKDSASVE